MAEVLKTLREKRTQVVYPFCHDGLALIDHQFKKRIAKGETEAIVELYDRHGESLLKYLVGKVGANNATDVLQNVFARLVRYHKRLAKAENLAAYIFLTARNESNRFLSSEKRIDSHGIEKEDNLPDNSTSFESTIEFKETALSLLAQLDDQSKEIVQLKIYSGLTFKEVGKIVGMPEQTAATKYRRGIEKLRKSVTQVNTTPINNPRCDGIEDENVETKH